MLSIANVYFRDTQHFMGILLQIWMFMTPIIYPISLIEERSAHIGGLLGTSVTVYDLYRLNPMERFVAVFRDLLYNNRWPAGEDVVYCVVCAVVVFVLGLLIFRKNERGLAEAL